MKESRASALDFQAAEAAVSRSRVPIWKAVAIDASRSALTDYCLSTTMKITLPVFGEIQIEFKAEQDDWIWLQAEDRKITP